MKSVAWHTRAPEETMALGRVLGKSAEQGTLILLIGDLGAGKTTLVQGLASGLGIEHGVKSPTFALHLQHEGRLTLHHLDLYRMADVSELDELGLDEVLGRDGVTVIEWGDRLWPRPEYAAVVEIKDEGEQHRVIVLEGPHDFVDAAAKSIETHLPELVRT